jgi:hypothetical protein
MSDSNTPVPLTPVPAPPYVPSYTAPLTPAPVVPTTTFYGTVENDVSSAEADVSSLPLWVKIVCAVAALVVVAGGLFVYFH